MCVGGGGGGGAWRRGRGLGDTIHKKACVVILQAKWIFSFTFVAVAGSTSIFSLP